MENFKRVLYILGVILIIRFIVLGYSHYQDGKRLKVNMALRQLNWDRTEMDTLIADSVLLQEQMKGIKGWQFLRTESDKASQIGQQTLKINKIKSALSLIREDIMNQQGIIKENQKSLF
ncbi:MAG TPA: hypothetical protein VN922_04690 [Bacteroidia bacterium]|nr:hypothetical protein [Bacteroidia bacterium]